MRPQFLGHAETVEREEGVVGYVQSAKFLLNGLGPQGALALLHELIEIKGEYALAKRKRLTASPLSLPDSGNTIRRAESQSQFRPPNNHKRCSRSAFFRFCDSHRSAKK